VSISGIKAGMMIFAISVATSQPFQWIDRAASESLSIIKKRFMLFKFSFMRLSA